MASNLFASFLQNENLNKYFNQVVQMSQNETSEVVNSVMENIARVLQCINEMDDRFCAEPIRVGSYYSKLKVCRADEFDLSIPLRYIGPLHFVPGRPMYFGFDKKVDESLPTAGEDLKIISKSIPLVHPGVEYVSVDLGEGEVADRYSNLMFQKYLIPYLVKIHLKCLTLVAVQKLGLKDAIDMDRVLHGPALTLSVKHSDPSRKPVRVNIDFAAAIQAKLPFQGTTDWPNRARLARWPDREKINKIMDMGINVVAKKNFHWAMSFAECEKALVYNMDSDGGIRKKIHRIMKGLWREVTNDGKNTKLTSYMLKSAWLWECEKYPSTSDWTTGRLSERFIGCVNRLKLFISSGKLPVYFYSAMDLLKGKASDLESMQETVNKMCSRLNEFQVNSC